jgi:DNA-binding NarL/FixJ family response regulator
MSADTAGLTVRPHLVGRERECLALDRLLDRLDQGARVVEITGDPGIGKTRLLAELAGRAAGRGLPVLAGRVSESAAPPPLGILLDALGDHWGGRLQDGAAGGQRAFEAVRALLASLAEPGMVLLLDDLHRADEASLDVLSRLLRRPPRAPVLIALAHRDRQSPRRLLAVLAAAAADRPVERLPLGPLGPEAAEVLLGSGGTRSWRRALHRRSGGNPFYLDALARDLPADARSALLAELEPLSPAARLAIESAAVAGDPVDPALAADVAGVAEPDLLAAVDELVDRDLLRPAAGARPFAFRHEVLRRAVYDGARPGWRLAAHARAAAALERHGADPVARARHVEHTARSGDEAAAALLAEAARTVRASDPATAARWLGRALQLLPDEDRTRAPRLTLLLGRARALGVAGHPRESRDTLHEALRLMSAEPAGRRTRAVAFCALMDRLLGRRAEAHALLLDELGRLPDQDAPEAVTLRLELACGDLMRGDVAACVGWATAALGGARRHGARPTEAMVLGVLAMAGCVTGDVEAAAAWLEEATALLDGLLDGELAGRLDAAIWVGWCELYLERAEAALRHLDRAQAVARATGQELGLPHLLAGRVLALRAAGRLAEAAECADDAVDLAVRSGSDEQHAGALAMRCWVATWTGDLETALTAGAEAAEKAPETASGWWAAAAARMLAEARLATGDVAGCLALVDRAGGPSLPIADAWSRIGWYELLTRAELARGNAAAAAVWADRAQAAAANLGLEGRRGLALLARAQVEAAREPGAGLDAARAAAGSLTVAGMVLDSARARLVAAGELAARGDVPDATAELRTARLIADACGARALARQALSERRRLAARAPRSRETRRRAGLQALTDRERQVGALVSEGLSNREIATRLHVTDKTVEMHVSNVLAKLSVASRAAAAGLIARAESGGRD